MVKIVVVTKIRNRGLLKILEYKPTKEVGYNILLRLIELYDDYPYRLPDSFDVLFRTYTNLLSYKHKNTLNLLINTL